MVDYKNVTDLFVMTVNFGRIEGKFQFYEEIDVIHMQMV